MKKTTAIICDYCGAAAGSPCVTAAGNPATRLHAARVDVQKPDLPRRRAARPNVATRVTDEDRRAAMDQFREETAAAAEAANRKDTPGESAEKLLAAAFARRASNREKINHGNTEDPAKRAEHRRRDKEWRKLHEHHLRRYWEGVAPGVEERFEDFLSAAEHGQAEDLRRWIRVSRSNGEL